MPFIPAGFSVVAHQLSIEGDADPMITTYGADWVTVPTVARANALKAAFETNIGAWMSDQYSSDLVTIYYATADNETTAIQSDTAPVPGDAAGTALPQNSAFLIHKRTGVGGRRGRGRMYVPGVPEAECTALGTLSSTWFAGLTASAAAFLVDVQAVTDLTDMVLLHSPGDTALPAPTPITALVLDPVIGTQRERMRR